MGTTYTIEQMRLAFEHVRNPKGGKILTKVLDYPGEENVDCLFQAIIHFTGEIPEITCHNNNAKIMVKILYDEIW